MRDFGHAVDVVTTDRPVADADPCRNHRAAHLVGQRAAIDEHARWQVGTERRKEPRDRLEPLCSLSRTVTGQASQQSHCVRMGRFIEHLIGPTFFDQLSRIEHADAVAHRADHAEIVGNEQHRRAVLRAQRTNEIEHLGLHRGIEPGGRFVEDQQLGIAGERHRNHDTLLHAPRQLVRITVHHQVRISDLDLIEHCPGLGHRFVA